MASTARLLDVGARPYREIWDLQRSLHAAVAAGEIADTWIVVEHSPVITLGRQARRENVLKSERALAAAGVDLVEVDRGGDVTYHGPGQVVVYPIRKLARFREVVPLVRALEGATIAACERFGISAQRWSEHPGVWVGENQICAVGLAVRRMVSMHGIALNASTQLNYDALINPCGLTGRGITSLSREAARIVSVEEAKAVLLEELARTFEVTFTTAAYEPAQG